MAACSCASVKSWPGGVVILYSVQGFLNGSIETGSLGELGSQNNVDLTPIKVVRNHFKVWQYMAIIAIKEFS
jgi:hypothetical protein